MLISGVANGDKTQFMDPVQVQSEKMRETVNFDR